MCFSAELARAGTETAARRRVCILLDAACDGVSAGYVGAAQAKAKASRANERRNKNRHKIKVVFDSKQVSKPAGRLWIARSGGVKRVHKQGN